MCSIPRTDGQISTVTNPVVSYTTDPKSCIPEAEIISTFVELVEGGHVTGSVVGRKYCAPGES